MNSMRSLAIVAAFAAVGDCAFAEGVTYYANGGGTKNNFSYDWKSTDNWRVDDGAGNLVVPTTVPQANDIVVFDKKVDYMSAAPDSEIHPALQKIVFNVGNTIHQGYVNLRAGGEGLWMKDGIGMSWWAGLRFTGVGEVPVHVPSGQSFKNQKGVQGDTTAILVKTGGGTFNTACEGKNVYKPATTVLMGGTFIPRVNGACQGHRFIWGSNDGGLRLRFAISTKDKPADADPSWTIQNGAMVESNVVDNTTHGLSTDYTEPCYLHLTGTPAVPDQRFTGQLYDLAGIDFAPGAKQADQSDYVFTIAKSVSSAGGGLKVSNGTLRLTEGASFTNLRLVSVGAGGSFTVEEGCGRDFACQTLEVAEGGKLKLAAGAVIWANGLSHAGQKLAVGAYSAAGGDGRVAVDWIEGEGVVIVNPIVLVDPIVLTVGEGATKTLAEALADYDAAHGEEVTVESLNGGADKGRTLVKDGKGTLHMDVAIASYVGAIEVRAGFLRCGRKNAFGADTESSHVNVCAGATVLCEMTSDNQNFNANRTFHVAGNGADGNGALRNGTTHLSYGTQNSFGKHLIVEADATVAHGPWHYLPNGDVTLKGHTLTYRPASGGTDVAVFFKTVNDDGKIVLNGSQNRFPDVVWNGTNPNNVFEMANKGGWRFWSSGIDGAGKAVWQMHFTSASCYVYGDTTQNGREDVKNTFWNPWTIDAGTVVSLTSQGNTAGSSAYLRGPVAGGGGFSLGNNGEPKYLHLLNPANSFSGAVTVDRGIVDVYDPGTLPKAATLTLNRASTFGSPNKEATLPAYYGAAFVSPRQQDLGACVLKGDYVGRVQGGLGRFASVAKSGKNTIEYYTQLGGGLLEVTGGTLKFPRGAAPGLWEGTNYSANVATDFAGAALATNLVMRGPHTANAVYTENFTPSAANRLMTYSGYVWNRTGADATWTFVSSVNGPVKVRIDGEDVIATTAATLAKAQKTLTPGPHRFEYRSYGGSPRSTGWTSNFGFAYDRQGRDDESNTNNFALCIDPGDGSLFTRSTDSADLPAFDAIRVATGATLDLNGNRYVANDISGEGTVASSATDASAAPKLVVKAMTVNAAKNETLNVTVPVELDANFTVNVTNVAKRLKAKHTILTAAAAFALPPTVSAEAEDGSGWCVRLSADGRSLELVRTGLSFIIR